MHLKFLAIVRLTHARRACDCDLVELWIRPQSWSSTLSPAPPYLRNPKTLGFARFQPKEVEK